VRHASVGGDSCERSERYGDTKRLRALLDYYDVAGVAGLGNAQIEMIVENQMKKCGTQTLGGTHVSAANVTATPNAYVRFWIITMLLVLMGLATLKLR
jgi:hypothetical protein